MSSLSPSSGPRFWSETRTADGKQGLYRGTLRDAKEGTPSTDIGSKWREDEAKKERRDADLQTEEVHTAAAGMQTVSLFSRSTMTDRLDNAGADGGVVGGLERREREEFGKDVPSEALLPFLENVAPLVLDELKSNEESTAFCFRTRVLDERNTTVDLQHVLKPKLSTTRATSNVNTSSSSSSSSGGGGGEKKKNDWNPHKLVCTQVSWNSTGYAVAGSYGRFDISGWCDTPGALVIWNLGSKRPPRGEGQSGQGNAKKKDRTKKSSKSEPSPTSAPGIESTLAPLQADVVIETDTCLQCCACHPTHPALVAAGSYAGEVYVWNVSASDNFASDSEVARSRITPSSHHDPVVAVAWHRSLKEGSYQLISLGMDGKVLVWQWKKGGVLDAPLKGYELVYANPKTHKMIVWGGTSMSFQRNTTTFVVGTEGGGVFRCLLDDMKDDSSRSSSSSTRSPIKADFVPHAGMTSAVASSPFHRSLFLTSGSDGTIKLFHVLEKKPRVELEPNCVNGLFSLGWSPVRPMLLAAGSGDGRVFFYDLVGGRRTPIKILDVERVGIQDLEYSKFPIYSLQFNPKMSRFFATSCGDAIRVWELGETFSAYVTGELGELEDFC